MYDNSDLLDIDLFIVHWESIECVKATSMEKEITVVLGKNKALFETWK